MDTIESVEDEVKSLGLDEVKKKLKDERASLHPDRNGGKFASENDEKRYHFVDEALNHIDVSESLPQMIPVTHLPAIIESVSKSLTVSSQPGLVEKTIKESFRSDLSRKYLAPKISSGIFAGITGFLFTQSTSLTQHPVVGDFFGSYFGNQLLGMLFMCSLFLFGFTWFKESKEEAYSAYLLSEDGLHEIYEVMQAESQQGTIEVNKIRKKLLRFSKPHFGLASLFFRPTVTPQALDQILEVQLRKMEERKAITFLDQPGIDKTYKINA